MAAAPARAEGQDRQTLTTREGQVLALVAEGLTARAVGRRLNIRESTVRKHLEHIYGKLGQRDRLTAVSAARESGLLTLEPTANRAAEPTVERAEEPTVERAAEPTANRAVERAVEPAVERAVERAAVQPATFTGQWTAAAARRGPAHAAVLLAEVDAALAEGRLDEAAEAVELHGPALHCGLVDVPIEILERWLTTLRPLAGDRPWLVSLQAWVCAALGQPVLAAVALRRAAALFASRPPQPGGPDGREMIDIGAGVIAERAGNHATAQRSFATAAARLPAHGLPGEIAASDARRWTSIDPSGAAGYWLAALSAAQHDGEPLVLARAYHNLAMECLRRGEPVIAYRLAGRACELKRPLAARASYANSLNTRGLAAAASGALDAAEDNFTEAAALARQTGQRLLLAYAGNNLAESALHKGDLDGARLQFARTLADKERLDDSAGLAWTLRAAATAERLAGEHTAAQRLLERAWALRAPLTNPTEAAQLLVARAAALAALDRTDDAARAAAQAREQAAAVDAKRELAVALLYEAALNARPGAADTAGALIQRYNLAGLAPELAAPALAPQVAALPPGARAVAGAWRPHAHPHPPTFARLVGLADAALADGRPALAEARYEQAVVRWTGPAVPAASLIAAADPASPRQSQESLLRCQERLASLALDRGDADRALHRAQEALAIDPHRESALRLCLRAQCVRNNHATARRTLLDFAARLSADLGTRPHPDLYAMVGMPAPDAG